MSHVFITDGFGWEDYYSNNSAGTIIALHKKEKRTIAEERLYRDLIRDYEKEIHNRFCGKERGLLILESYG